MPESRAAKNYSYKKLGKNKLASKNCKKAKKK